MRGQKLIPPQVTSDRFFWRWQALFYRTGTYWNNSLYALYRNIVQGPLGFRSLLSPTAFYPDTICDPVTGVLKTGPKQTQSFASRLQNLWSSIFQSRKEFEEKPDAGFLGKSVVRVFNVIWNYLIKGLIGTALVVLVQPVLSIGNILASTLLVVTSMIWCPIGSILVYLFTILIYDFESPIYSRLWPRLLPLIIGVGIKKILYGAIKVVGSAAAILGHFLGFFLVTAGCGIHTAIRYDLVMFYLVVRWRARIPAHDSFAARRILGPGLSREAFFQIDPDLALVALQVEMEIAEMDMYAEAAMVRIKQARRESVKHINHYLQPLGLDLPSSHPVLMELHHTESNLIEKFRKLRKKRNEEFPFLVDGVPNRDRIVLERADLDYTLRRATAAVEHFYTTKIFPMKSKAYQERFWEDRSLLPQDYSGLACALLTNIFSSRFLSPLDEADKSVALKIHHTGVHQYAEGLMHTGAIPDDLSVSEIEYHNYFEPSVSATVKERWDANSLSSNSLNVNADDVLEKYKKKIKRESQR